MDIDQIKAGNEKAFEELFRTYYGPLCGYATKMVEDVAEAEEIVGNMFFQFWEKREQLEITTSLKAYLYRSVHNACLNHIKHQKVKQAYVEHINHTTTEINSQDTLEQKELAAEIRTAISSLPEKCQEVFDLVKLQGLKYREVATLLGVSEKTVENQMGKALRVLRDKLGHLVRVLLPLLLFFHQT